jgi:hypothetical protein
MLFNHSVSVGMEHWKLKNNTQDTGGLDDQQAYILSFSLLPIRRADPGILKGSLPVIWFSNGGGFKCHKAYNGTMTLYTDYFGYPKCQTLQISTSWTRKHNLSNKNERSNNWTVHWKIEDSVIYTQQTYLAINFYEIMKNSTYQGSLLFSCWNEKWNTFSKVSYQAQHFCQWRGIYR